MKKILFVGGGSVGHTAPAVAVWEKLKEVASESHAHFVCADRSDEKEFLEKFHAQYSVAHAPKFSFSFPWKFVRALREADHILSTEKPDCIFSTGGFMSVPLCMRAARKGIPIILHESDAVSGRANHFLARRARRITTGFPIETSNAKYQHTGNPVRKEITEGNREKGYELTGFDSTKPVLLVMGGSQGAQAINEAVGKVLPELLTLCNVIHITGRGKSLYSIDHTGYFAREFVTDELADLYSISTLALSRAGAGSIAELTACHIPMILVPLPDLAHNHQEKNALLVERAGRAILLPQHKLESEVLSLIRSLLENKNRLSEIKENLEKKSKNDAALQIAEIISQTLDHTDQDA